MKKANLLSYVIAAGLLSGAAPTGTPPVLTYEHESKTIAYKVKVRPGVPNAGGTVNIEVELEEILTTPDPTYGDRKPINNAEIIAVMVSPKTRRQREGAWVDARLGTPLGDAGAYGFSFTPTTGEGVYGLYFQGSTPSAGAIEHSVLVSVDVWPIPEKTKTPALPRKIPTATIGNLSHGKALCAEYCKKDIPGALPQGDVPAFLPSDFAAALSDGELLGAIAGQRLHELSATDRLDLVHYLRSLHLHVNEFFPEVAVHTSNVFTINKHGLERLSESAGIKLENGQADGKVFIVYKGEAKNGKPQLIAYDDRVSRDKIKRADKLGYLIFFNVEGDKRTRELGIAVGREPTYPIVNIISRDAANHRDSSTNRALRSYTRLGKFNDPGSLRRGSSSVRGMLTPHYLRAAELATMYYAEEREFTAFDDEFN